MLNGSACAGPRRVPRLELGVAECGRTFINHVQSNRRRNASHSRCYGLRASLRKQNGQRCVDRASVAPPPRRRRRSISPASKNSFRREPVGKIDPFRPWQCTRRWDATVENHLAWQWLQKVSGGRNSLDCFGGRWQPRSPFSAHKQKSTIRDVPFLRCTSRSCGYVMCRS